MSNSKLHKFNVYFHVMMDPNSKRLVQVKAKNKAKAKELIELNYKSVIPYVTRVEEVNNG